MNNFRNHRLFRSFISYGWGALIASILAVVCWAYQFVREFDVFPTALIAAGSGAFAAWALSTWLERRIGALEYLSSDRRRRAMLNCESYILNINMIDARRSHFFIPTDKEASLIQKWKSLSLDSDVELEESKERFRAAIYQEINPPKAGLFILGFSAPREIWEQFAGDVYEAYFEKLERSGFRTADRWYWHQVAVAAPRLAVMSFARHFARDYTLRVPKILGAQDAAQSVAD